MDEKHLMHDNPQSPAALIVTIPKC
jgi:hypothetical protein